MADRALIRRGDGAVDRLPVAAPSSEIGRLEAEIAAKRARVAVSLDDLRRRVEEVTSWRRWAADHPLVWMGAGLCLGIFIGSRGSRRRRLA